MIPYKALSILLMAFLFISCEKRVDNVVLPGFEEKLVVECFLNPDDTVTYIHVATNKNIFGELNEYQPTGILTGTITNGTLTTELSVCSTGLYFSHNDLPVEQGQNYTLAIESSKGYSVNSTCTIPVTGSYLLEADTTQYAVIYEYMDEYYGGYYSYRYNYVDIDLYLTDNSDISNYYSVAIKQVIYDKSYYENPYVYTGMWDEDFYSGETKGEKKLLFSNTFSYDIDYAADSVFQTYYLMATDKEFHTYKNSFNNYNDGEVFSEVSPLYSNIEGGLGIFASYTVADSIIVKLK